MYVRVISPGKICNGQYTPLMWETSWLATQWRLEAANIVADSTELYIADEMA